MNDHPPFHAGDAAPAGNGLGASFGGDTPSSEPRTATDRSLAIIDLILNAQTRLNAKMIGAELDLPKATVHRLLGMLEDKGLIVKDAVSNGYIPGPSLCDMAYKILRHSASSANRRAILASLALHVGETCNLGMLDGVEARYLDRVEPSHSPLKLDFRPGSRVPLYCSAMGHVFLSLMPERSLDRYIETVNRTAHTASTLVDETALRSRIAQTKARGHGEDDEEYVAGVNCLSVAVPTQHGRNLIALAIQAPKSRLTLEELRKFLPAMKTTAEKMARILDNEASAGIPASRTRKA